MYRSSTYLDFLFHSKPILFGHFSNIFCSIKIHTEHRPSYQYCLNIIEQCQSLFDVTCFTQLPTALNELYYRHGELTNFKRSVATTLGITGMKNHQKFSFFLNK